MTTLILAHQQISTHALGVFRSIRGSLAGWNPRGWLTVCCFGIAVIAMVGYLASVFWVYQMSFSLRSAGERREKVERTLSALELILQEHSRTINTRERGMLAGMEAVTRMRYLSTEHVAEADVRTVR